MGGAGCIQLPVDFAGNDPHSRSIFDLDARVMGPGIFNLAALDCDVHIGVAKRDMRKDGAAMFCRCAPVRRVIAVLSFLGGRENHISVICRHENDDVSAC